MVQWLPLESNPEVITKFMHNMGVEESIECVDVLGFDEDLLAMLPYPHYALILCYPDYKKVEKIMAPVYEELKKEGASIPENVFFMNQKIGNACGTFALFHSLVNNRDNFSLGNGALKNWLDKALKLSPDERSDLLANDKKLSEAHENCARSGVTQAELGQVVEHHFVCYINANGILYEIDSSAPFPRACGSTNQETLLKDAGKMCMNLMSKMDDLSFSALALVRAK